jgi:serine/threonine protein kinase
MLRKLSLKDTLLPQPASFNKKRSYELHEILGQGTFGKVIRATWTPSPGSPLANGVTPQPKDVALKVISKKKVKGNEELVWGEMEVLKGLDHPNIVSASLLFRCCGANCSTASSIALLYSLDTSLIRFLLSSGQVLRMV